MRVAPQIRLDHAVMALGTALLPVYTFGSGGIQPAHMVFAIFSALILLTNGIPVRAWSLSLFAIAAISLVVESIYIMLGAPPLMLVQSVFFFYNFVLACAVFVYVQNNGPGALAYGLMVATIVALVSVLLSGVSLVEFSDAGRATGTFRNPNQLGFFALCQLSLTYLFYRTGNLPYWAAIVLFGAAFFLVLASLSKAAIAAGIVVIAFVLKPEGSKAGLVAWAVGILVAIIGMVVLASQGVFDSFLAVERFRNIQAEGDSSLVSRGYLAFADGNGVQFIFGLGTDQVLKIVGHEVHSTLASVLNNYGVLGFAAFGCAIGVWIIQAWRGFGTVGMICLTMPAMLYGITHNGTRFTIFWLLFATTLAMAQRRMLTAPRPGAGGAPVMSLGAAE